MGSIVALARLRVAQSRRKEWNGKRAASGKVRGCCHAANLLAQQSRLDSARPTDSFALVPTPLRTVNRAIAFGTDLRHGALLVRKHRSTRKRRASIHDSIGEIQQSDVCRAVDPTETRSLQRLARRAGRGLRLLGPLLLPLCRGKSVS